MNLQSRNGKPKIPWMKFALIAVVLIVVVVFSGRAGIEQLLDLKPGTLGGSTSSQADDSDDSPKFDVDTAWKKSDDQSDNKSGDSDFELVRDGQVMRSPEGLTYYLGGRESRIDHVLHHAKDDRSKPVHGVFTVDAKDIFPMIDEAYKLVKAKSRKVLKTKPESGTDKIAYDVEMDRKIGYKGGRTGSKDKHLTVLRLVLDKGIRVITAFPAR